MLNTATLLKMGDGPINFDWNPRYFVLDEKQRTLTWFNSEFESIHKG